MIITVNNVEIDLNEVIANAAETKGFILSEIKLAAAESDITEWWVALDSDGEAYLYDANYTPELHRTHWLCDRYIDEYTYGVEIYIGEYRGNVDNVYKTLTKVSHDDILGLFADV